jgi:hypothetical protein
MGKAKAAKQLRREQREAAAGKRFYHGGVAGLEPGDFLLSPMVTRDPASVSTSGMREARADRVYFTTDVELARAFAAIIQDTAGTSAVYEVRPIDDFEVDADYPATGFQSVKALIVGVVEVDINLTKAERGIRCQPYETYTDGRHVHDESGRLQLSPPMAAAGFTQKYLDDNFPLWTSPEEAGFVMARELSRRAGGR